MSEHQKAECVTALPAGTYRVMDGKLYRVEPGLPPSLDTRDAKIATLRTRAEQAEADVRAYQKRCADFEDALNRAEAERDDWNARWHKLAEQTFAAEAEVARLRGELDCLRVTAADIETMRQMTEDVRAIGARSEALARESALREAAGVCRQMQEALENLDARRRCLLSADVQELALSDAEDRILALLDAPAAEVKP